MKSDNLFSLLQFVALTLPAIMIYTQVLVAVYQKEKNIEINGQVIDHYKNANGERVRAPENDPNIIEALPELVTNVDSQLDFVLSLVSIVIFLLAGVALAGHLLISTSYLVSVGVSLIIIGIISFISAIIVTMYNISKNFI